MSEEIKPLIDSTAELEQRVSELEAVLLDAVAPNPYVWEYGPQR